MFFHDPQNKRAHATRIIAEYFAKAVKDHPHSPNLTLLQQAEKHATSHLFDELLADIRLLPESLIADERETLIDFLTARQNYINSGDYNTAEIRAFETACDAVLCLKREKEKSDKIC